MNYILSGSWGGYLIILVSIISYMFFWHIKKYAFKSLFFIRLNYAIIGVLITIILAYIFGINSGILGDYDRGVHPTSFNFLKPYDAIRFPFEQLRIENGKREPFVLNLDSSISLNKSNYLIIVDKTKSTNLADTNSTSVKKLMEGLKTKILDTQGCVSPERFPQTPMHSSVLSDLDLRDLVVLYFLKSIYCNADNSTIFSYQILLYYGDNIFSAAGASEDRPTTEKVSFSSAFYTYIENVKHATVPIHQSTNFKNVLDKLFDEKYIKNNGLKTNAIVLSDFDHEPVRTGISFDAIESLFDSRNCADNKFKLSLYLLSNNQGLNDNSKRTVNIINRKFKNARTYFFDEQMILNDPEKYENYLLSLFSYTIINENANIDFFSPHDNYKKISSATSICKIEDNGEYLINFNNQNQPLLNNDAYLTVNSETIGCNKRRIISSKNKMMNMEIFSKDMPLTDNYLDISVPGKLITHSFKINILEKLPRTSILVMCICYMTILLVFFSNSFIYLYCSWKSLKYDRNYFHSMDSFSVGLHNDIPPLQYIGLLIFQSFIAVWLILVIWKEGAVLFELERTLFYTISILFIMYVAVSGWKNRLQHLNN